MRLTLRLSPTWGKHQLLRCDLVEGAFVRDDHDGERREQRPERVDEVLLGRAVEIGRRLVEDEKFWPTQKRPRDGQALFLSRRKFGNLVERLREPARQRFDGFRSAVDVHDVVHEVFRRAFEPRAREAYSGLTPFPGYLFVITRNVVLRRLDKGRREEGLDDA